MIGNYTFFMEVVAPPSSDLDRFLELASFQRETVSSFGSCSICIYAQADMYLYVHMYGSLLAYYSYCLVDCSALAFRDSCLGDALSYLR